MNENADTSRTQRKQDEAILRTLRDLAGARFQESDLTFEGSKLIIPAQMTADDAMRTIKAHIKAQETITQFSNVWKFRPWDGAAATARAIKALTGTSGVGKAQFSFFGVQPPEQRTIPIGVNESISVPWGEVEVPLFEGSVYFNMVEDPELGPLFQLMVECPKKHGPAVQGLFKLITDELQTNSIYRGKAITGAAMPDFLDLTGVERSKVIYSDPVEHALDANVWAMLRHTDAMREGDVPLKRSVLFYGPYGTGKTLGAFLTAQEAVANGWTFVYCRPGKDNLDLVMQTARLYQPAVVFFEDVDTVSAAGEEMRTDEVTRLLDMFDGITAKGTELLAILTTNHVEKIHKGMVRPGRLDAMIEVSTLDEGGVTRMIESLIPQENRGDLDYHTIAEAMEDFLPAFVKEAVDRTKRYLIARTGKLDEVLTTEDFVRAANDLRPQLDIMNGASETAGGSSVDSLIRRAVREELDTTTMVRPSDRAQLGVLEHTD